MAGGRTRRFPTARWSLLTLGVALVALVTAAHPATATTPTRPHLTAARFAAAVADPATVVTLSDPGVELTAPADGRLRGDGVALVVTGAALTDRAGAAAQQVSAGGGRHLIVFGLRQVPQPAGETGPPASLALVVAGQRRPVDVADLAGSTPGYFAASIPDATTDATLELTAAGYSQDFDLMTLTRTGPSPVVLYRDADDADADTAVNASLNVAATVPADPGQSYTDTITVTTVTLSYFAPTPAADTAPALDEAYLEITATAKPVLDVYGGHDVQFSAPIPANMVHLTLPDGTTVAAAQTGCACDEPDLNDYVVATTYYFVVPANIAAATLHVDAYQGAGWESINETGSRQTIALAGFTIPLTLNSRPAAPPPAASTTPVTVLKLTHTQNPTTAGTGAANPVKAPDQAPLWIVLLLVAAAGVFTWRVMRRRRHHRQPAAITAAATNRDRPPTPVPAPVAIAAGPVPVASNIDTLPDPPSPPAVPPRPPAAGQETLPFPTPPPVPAPEDPPEPLPAAETSDDDMVSLCLLGPREVTGAGTAKLRPRELEVFVFLAVNAGRSVTNDDIRAAVAGAVDDESNAKTVRTWLSRIRAAVGPSVLPEAEAGRYRLAQVRTDIADFDALTARAAETDIAETVALLTQALTLIRGRPFEGLDYRWTHVTVAHLETRIADAADHLADLSIGQHDPATATWAARQGLAAVVQPDDRLLGQLLLAASEQGPAQLAQAWREVTARYAAVGDAPTPDVAALHDQLRTADNRR